MSDDEDNYAHRFLELHRKRYEQGDKRLLLYCLNWCLTNHVPVPAWLKQKFAAALMAANSYQIKSWEEVFGGILPKGKQLKAAQRDVKIAGDVFDRVRGLHEEDNKKNPISKGLFEKVGAEFGIKGTKAEELYYKMVNELKELISEEDELSTPGKN